MVELSYLTRRFDLPTNRLYRIRENLLRKGEKIVDFVSGNVNAQGLHFPPRPLQRALIAAARKTKLYRPDPLGQQEAREAISRYYAAEGLPIGPEQILITPGTSVSYWFAFKVLADPGDEILAPSPSYPLFESIAELSGVKLIPYLIREAARWEIDFDTMESAISPRTRAIVLISPHNPTGAVATGEEVRRLSEVASRNGIAIIADEVFGSFLFNLQRLPRPALAGAPLVVTLNGFSKMLALPGLKIGWMTVTGDSILVKKTIEALDMISDTFLPVNEIAQAAVPQLLRDSKVFLTFYRSEIYRRMKLATDLLNDRPGIFFARPEGGFFLTVALKKHGVEEEEIACRLLEKQRILVHPGYFYDMEGQHLILSFANRLQVLRRALDAVMEEIRRGQKE